LLGFVGFQKSKNFLATDGGLFVSSGIHKRMPLELMSVIFITLLKGKWLLGYLFFHKLLSVDRHPVYGSLEGVSQWLPIDGYGALASAPQARKHMCSYLYMVHILLKRFSTACVSDDQVKKEIYTSPDKRVKLSSPLSNLGEQVFSWSLQSPQIMQFTSRILSLLHMYMGGGLLLLPKLHY
jgi:hypothetical protein